MNVARRRGNPLDPATRSLHERSAVLGPIRPVHRTILAFGPEETDIR
jgi:hypothetical protein